MINLRDEVIKHANGVFKHKLKDINTNTTWFTRILTALDTSAQLALNTLDLNCVNTNGIIWGQVINGWKWASENIRISSTSNATKGNILFWTSVYDEVNDRLGIGVTPSYKFQVGSNLIPSAAPITLGTQFNYTAGATTGTNGIFSFIVNKVISIGETGSTTTSAINSEYIIPATSTVTIWRSRGGYFSVTNLGSGDLSVTNGSSNIVNHSWLGVMQTGNAVWGTISNQSTGTISNANGMTGTVGNYWSGIITTATGVSWIVRGALTAIGSITTARWLYSALVGNASTIGTYYGLLMEVTNTWTIGTRYGVYQTDKLSTNYFWGSIGIGTSVPSTQFELSVDQPVSPSNRTATLTSSHNTAAGAGYILGFQRSRGTVAIPTAISSGDTIGSFRFSAYGTTSYGLGATITNQSTEAWTDTARGNKFSFAVTPNGTTVNVTAMTIDQSGNIGIGTITTPTARLHLPAQTASAGTAPIKLVSGTPMTTPEAWAIEMATNRLLWTNAMWERFSTSFVSSDSVVITDTIVDNSLVETTILTDTQLANTLNSKKIIHLNSTWTYSKVNTSDRATVRIKVGWVVVSTWQIPVGAATNLNYHIETFLTVRWNWVWTQVVWHSHLDFDWLWALSLPVNTTIDTTINNAIEVTWQWDTAAIWTKVISNAWWVELKG